MRPRILSTSLLVALLALATAVRAGGLDMASLWPNADGLGWTYDQSSESLVPPVPVSESVVRVLFDGTTVAPVGIDCQLLRGQLLSGPLPGYGGASEPADPFLRQLLRARPDLRASVLAKSNAEPCVLLPAAGFASVLLSPDLALRKTASEVAAWRCNADNLRSWQWLVSDLTIGNTFTLQLIPDIASDVFLHGRVAAVEVVTVPAGTFASCLRVDYVVDYGLTSCTDEYGTPVGTSRSETRGSIHYASGVGPVRVAEEFVPYAQVSGDCLLSLPIDAPSSRTSLRLALLPVGAVSTTWGRLKLLYR